MAENLSQPEKEPQPSQPSAVRIIPARELFQQEREICIEHDGIRYRLRITRRNRLILQK